MAPAAIFDAGKPLQENHRDILNFDRKVREIKPPRSQRLAANRESQDGTGSQAFAK